MPDREFKIRITTEADSTGARQTISDLEKLREAGTGANKQIAEEVGKLGLKHADLRAAIRAAHMEFPELARAAHFALHPAGLAVAGLIGAMELYKKRVEEATKVMAGFQLPDNSFFDPAHISGLAEAWDKYVIKLSDA